MQYKLLKLIMDISKYSVYIMLIQIVTLQFVSANETNGQSLKETQVSISVENASLEEIISLIENQTEFVFTAEGQMVGTDSRIDLKLKKSNLKTVLDRLAGEFEYNFKRVNQNIYVWKGEKDAAPPIEEIVADVDITGKITDENGEGLPGASVIEKGTANGTTTGLDGNYKLNLPEDASIVISFVGYKTTEVAIAGRSTIDIQMELDAEQLEEVVVIGYGTQRKKDLTGAVGVVDGNEIAARRVTNVSNALQGAVAGVTVTRSSSAPGAGNTVLIRGITTLQGNSSPLILVDNVPVESMNDVNPDNVESISVLKDGASAAIYGSRAAAGVIIITTKRAESDVFSLSYNGEVISNIPTQTRRTVGAIRYMELSNEKQWNDNGNNADEFPVWSEDLITNYNNNHISNPDQYPNTNWRNLILKNNSTGYRHNLVLSGGSEKLKTIAAFGYEYQDALYDHRDWKRYTARINNDLKINPKLGATLNVAFKLTNDNQPIVDPTRRAIESAAIYPALWLNGKIAEGKTGDNIYAQLHQGGYSRNDSYLLYGKAELYYKPFEDLKISLNLAPNVGFSKYKSFNKSIPYWAFDDPNGLANPSYIIGHNNTQIALDERRINNNTLTSQALVNYHKSFEGHNINAVLGYEEFSSDSEALRVIGTEFTANDYPFLSQAPVDKIFDAGTSISENAYASSFARFGYNYEGKYYFQATVRRDGSSRFAPDYRWGTFPSLSAGWVLTAEEFMKSLEPISFLKLRASYGQLGNDRLGNYLYLSVLQFSNVYLANGGNVDAVRSAAQLYLSVKDITWETTSTLDFGVDLGLLEDMLSFTIDYFNKETTDMLLDLSIPSLSGYNDPTVNVGSMNTKGWELSTTWRDHIGELKYSASLNLFDSKSVIGNVNKKRLFDGNTLSEEGIEFQSWYGYQSDGIFQTQEEVDDSAVTNSSVSPGDIKYKDLSGPEGVPDGVINELDKVVLGGSQARMQYGGNINLQYKGFDLGLTFQGVGKRNYYLSSTFTRPFQESWLSPPELLEGKYWSMYNTPEQNLGAEYPRYSEVSRDNNYIFSDFWLINGGYLRIKNITLGYTLPSDFIKNTGLSNMRIYAVGNDLLTFDSLPEGIDPEQGAGYLITKSFIVGIKASF
ncbi:MAG: TonB-dependent receptor [Cyclobacteriaceae bacterium]